MIYALTAIVVVQILLIGYLLTQARIERKDLEDRVMALAQPVSLVTHRSITDPEPGNVTYVDEAREAELSPSHAFE